MLSHKFHFSLKNLRRKTCLYFFLWKKLNTLFTWFNYTWTIPRAFDHDLNQFKLYCLRMLSDRLLAHTVRVLDKSLFPMGRCGFRFQYSRCRRIQNFTSGQDLVLSDWLFWPTTHSLHRSLLVHLCAVQLTGTSTLATVTVVNKVSNKTILLHMIFMKLFILFTPKTCAQYRIRFPANRRL